MPPGKAPPGSVWRSLRPPGCVWPEPSQRTGDHTRPAHCAAKAHRSVGGSMVSRGLDALQLHMRAPPLIVARLRKFGLNLAAVPFHEISAVALLRLFWVRVIFLAEHELLEGLWPTLSWRWAGPVAQGRKMAMVSERVLPLRADPGFPPSMIVKEGLIIAWRASWGGPAPEAIITACRTRPMLAHNGPCGRVAGNRQRC